MKTQTYYALASKKTGELLRIDEQPTNSTYYCGETQVEFIESEDYPEYLVDDRLTAEKAKLFNSDWYNSTTECPAHSKINLNEYKVVRVTKTTKVEELIQPPTIRTFEGILDNIVGHPQDKSLVIALLFKDAPVKVGDLFWRRGCEAPEEVISIETLEKVTAATLRPCAASPDFLAG